MTRAQETGEIIREVLCKKSQSCPLIVEGFPHPTPRLPGIKRNKKMTVTKKRMDEAFAKYFTPIKGKKHRHETLVCHGNLIRYFITKVLKMKSNQWLDLAIWQCSLTTVRISDKGILTLFTYGEVGHIPSAKRTQS